MKIGEIDGCSTAGVLLALQALEFRLSKLEARAVKVKNRLGRVKGTLADFVERCIKDPNLSGGNVFGYTGGVTPAVSVSGGAATPATAATSGSGVAALNNQQQSGGAATTGGGSSLG